MGRGWKDGPWRDKYDHAAQVTEGENLWRMHIGQGPKRYSQWAKLNCLQSVNRVIQVIFFLASWKRWSWCYFTGLGLYYESRGATSVGPVVPRDMNSCSESEGPWTGKWPNEQYVVKLQGCLRDVPLNEAFVIGSINEKMILGTHMFWSLAYPPSGRWMPLGMYRWRRRAHSLQRLGEVAELVIPRPGILALQLQRGTQWRSLEQAIPLSPA